MIATALAFLTGPMGRVLLIALMCAGIYVKGRVDQGHVDEVRQEAATSKLVAENMDRVEKNGRNVARLSNGHAQEIAELEREKRALQERIKNAPMTASIQPKEKPNAKPGDPAPAPVVVDVDDILLGPDFVGLWNDAYDGTVQGVPGAGEPAGPVPAPGKAEADQGGRDSDTAGRGDETRGRREPGQDLRGQGGEVDRVVSGPAEMSGSLACWHCRGALTLDRSGEPIFTSVRIQGADQRLHKSCADRVEAEAIWSTPHIFPEGPDFYKSWG